MLILAVDDETLMLNMLVETLKNVFSDERYVVMGFDDGKEALEYVSSSEESLPYAFLDIRLRGMLGIELAKETCEIVAKELDVPAYRQIVLALRDKKTASMAVKRFLEYLDYRNA